MMFNLRLVSVQRVRVGSVPFAHLSSGVELSLSSSELFHEAVWVIQLVNSSNRWPLFYYEKDFPKSSAVSCKRSIPPSCESCIRGRVAQTDEERQIGCLSCHRSSGSTRLAGRSSVQPYEHTKGHVSVWAASFVVRLIVNGDATRGCRVTSLSGHDFWTESGLALEQKDWLCIREGGLCLTLGKTWKLF